MWDHGREKIGLPKNGRCPLFFFLKRPFLFFLFHGRCAHCAPISFFFWSAHYVKKKIMGNLPTDFFVFSYIFVNCSTGRTFLKKKNWNKKLNWGSAPIKRPLFFFIFPPIIFEKKSWACAHRAPMSFFFSAHDPTIPS